MADPLASLREKLEALKASRAAGEEPVEVEAAPPATDDPLSSLREKLDALKEERAAVDLGGRRVIPGDPTVEVAKPSEALLTREDMAQAAENRLEAAVEDVTFEQGVAGYRPEVGRIIARGRMKFPDIIRPEHMEEVPAEEPGFIDKIMTTAAALPAAAMLGRRGGASPYVDIEEMKREGLWDAVGAQLEREAEKPAGTRMTALDTLFGALSTPERLSAADDVAELTGETYGQALYEALKMPQADPSRVPRDYLYVEQERAYRGVLEGGGTEEEAQAAKYTPGVFGRAIGKSLVYDPTAWLRTPTTAVSKASAVKNMRRLALKFAKQKPGVGGAIGFSNMIANLTEETLSTGDFFGDMLRLKDRLRQIDPELALTFDAQAMRIGREGWKVANPILDTFELVTGATGGALRGAGGALRAPATLGRIVTREGTAARAVATAAGAAPEIAGEALGAVGRAVGAPGRKLAGIRAQMAEAVGDELAAMWIGPAARTSKAATRASEILDSTPWGRLQAEAAKVLTTEAEDFPRGIGAAWRGERTAFDAYAARKSYHHQRKVVPDRIAHDTSRSFREISQVGSEATVMRHAERTGRTLLNWAKGKWGVGHRTWIDHSTGEIREAVRSGRRLEDERGFVQALFDWVHVRSKELMDDGSLVSVEDAGHLMESIERRNRILAQIDALDAAAKKAWDDSMVKTDARLTAQGQRAAGVASERTARAQEMEALVARLRAEYYELAAEEGRLVGEITRARRQLNEVDEAVGALGLVGLRPRRHPKLKDNVVSIPMPEDLGEAGRLVPGTWVPTARPKGYPKNRLYYKQKKGSADLSFDQKVALERQLAKAEARLGVARRHMDMLSGRAKATAGRAEDLAAKADSELEAVIDRLHDKALVARDVRIRRMAAAQERMASMLEASDETTKASQKRLMDIDFELRNAIRRAYSQTLEEARVDPTVVPELRLAQRLEGVSVHFGADLQGTYQSALRTLDDDVADWADIHDHLDERVASIYEFVSNRYDNVLEELRDAYGGEDTVEKLQAYTLHQIQNRDRILQRYPNKRLVGAESSSKHRKILTLKELKEQGYDPVEDVLTSLAAAEVAAAELKWSRHFVDRALRNQKWSIPEAQWEKGMHGGDVMPFTHPATGERFVVDKEIGASLERLLHASSDVETRTRMGWFFDTVLVNPWKAWATYTRPSFHLRNAYSNLWLMYAGGYDMTARPERMSQALQIGALRKLEESGPDVMRTKRVLRRTRGSQRKRQLRAAVDRMEDRWLEKLEEWGNQSHTLPSGDVVTGKQLYQEMAQHGVVNKRWQAADVDRKAAAGLELSRSWDVASVAWKALPLSTDSYILKLGSEAGLFVENHARAALYLDRRLHHGDSVFEAAKSVKDHLFDYKDLTKADKAVRRYIPFWTWARKATAHEFWSLVDNPRKYAMLGRAKRYTEESAKGYWREDAEAKAGLQRGMEWMRRRNGWQTWFSTPQGSPLMWDPSMPWQEFQRFTPLLTMAEEGAWPGMQDALMGLLGQTVPILKLPVAVPLDLKMPEGRPFIAEQEANWLTGRILDAMGLRVRYAKTEDGRTVPVYDERHIYALENQFPHIAVLSKTFSDPKADPVLEERRQAQRRREMGGVMRLGESRFPQPIGFGFYPMNPAETRRTEANQLARELERYRRGARRYEPL